MCGSYESEGTGMHALRSSFSTGKPTRYKSPISLFTVGTASGAYTLSTKGG